MQQFGMNTENKAKRGPPFKPDSERRVQRSIRLLPRHWDKVDNAGKDEFEAYLDAWKPKKTKPAE